ncbi:hypothetical protein FCOIX_1063 [Fusarium coicis]|nr:hypothetical protein FCOIX_1063 [Fusarium coicis]
MRFPALPSTTRVHRIKVLLTRIPIPVVANTAVVRPALDQEIAHIAVVLGIHLDQVMLALAFADFSLGKASYVMFVSPIRSLTKYPAAPPAAKPPAAKPPAAKPPAAKPPAAARKVDGFLSFSGRFGPFKLPGKLACLEVAEDPGESVKSFFQKFRRSTIAVAVQTNKAPIEEAQGMDGHDQQRQVPLTLQAMG